MNYGGDAAEQVVRMSLEGVDVALRISGSAAKNLVAIFAALSKEEKATRGKARLTSMLKSGKELTVFSIPKKDIKAFTQEAKKYGVLYCVVKSKRGQDNAVDIITRIEDAPKINRIVERFNLAAVDTGKIARESEPTKSQDKSGSGIDRLLDEVLTADPQRAGTEKDPLFGQNSKNMEQGRGTFSSKKPSVREKLESYRKAELEDRDGILEHFLSRGKKDKERE